MNNKSEEEVPDRRIPVDKTATVSMSIFNISVCPSSQNKFSRQDAGGWVGFRGEGR